MRSFQAPGNPIAFQCTFLSHVEPGLLPTLGDEAVSFLGLKQISYGYPVLPMKTKPQYHHVPCSTGLLNKSLSTFTLLCHVSAYGSCVLPNCPTAGGQHAAELPSCHLLARLYLSTWEGRSCFSAALSVCIPCATQVPVNYQVLWHTFLMNSQVFSKICFGSCCPAARNSYRIELGGQTRIMPCHTLLFLGIPL